MLATIVASGSSSKAPDIFSTKLTSHPSLVKASGSAPSFGRRTLGRELPARERHGELLDDQTASRKIEERRIGVAAMGRGPESLSHGADVHDPHARDHAVERHV